MNRMILNMSLALAATILVSPALAAGKPGGGGLSDVLEVSARTAVVLRLFCPTPGQSCTTTETIPEGMRLVIESVTGELYGPDSSLRDARLTCQVDSYNGYYYTFLIAGPTREVSPGLYKTLHEHSIRAYCDSYPSVFLLAPLPAMPQSNALYVVGYLVEK